MCFTGLRFTERFDVLRIYFSMLVYSPEPLNHVPSTLNPKPHTLNPKPYTSVGLGASVPQLPQPLSAPEVPAEGVIAGLRANF